MDYLELAEKIDQTLLRPEASAEEYARFLCSASEMPFASICVPPLYVEGAVSVLADTPTKVTTVAGFPLGFDTTLVKLVEAKEAAGAGADELDMVANISAIKTGDFQLVTEEVAAITAAVPELTVKVIIECCYLTDSEKRSAVDAIARGCAAFVKTSSGMASGGATLSDVRLLKEASDGRVKVKAAGGIKTLKQALDFIEAGADRIGTSSGHKILAEL